MKERYAYMLSQFIRFVKPAVFDLRIRIKSHNRLLYRNFLRFFRKPW